MDSGTHLVIGLGLAGLAYVDPVIAADHTFTTAVLIGTVLGSQAPDADTLLRFKGNAAYIKNHRGASHSLPALAIWTILITLLLSALFGPLPIGHVALWVFIAVAFHVFTDLFNTYGTQALRPITEKWISWNIIHIFDPFIFMSHVIAIFMWSFHLGEPQTIFPILYGVIAIYYIWRTVYHYILEKNLPIKDTTYEPGDKYMLTPTFHFHHWQIVKTKPDGSFQLGEYRNNRIRWVDRVSCANHPAVEASRTHPDIASFLYYSKYSCAEYREHSWGYEVRWADVRYRHRKQYPFVAVLLMNHDYKPLDSYVGWRNESRLEKKLRVDSYS
ncbi:metal-dependent hydrolase [Paenibacillus hamazuiensis]|uniref:metal-dependent hydrolase n=1 Tax=Paenibacillus hamazuiensis TaxID=2936508 RepID=UPI00200BAE5D|nr:metal-dependent hydrolase [Paenibacillus hamazuiensis]